MIVEIKGVNFVNKGAELMLRAILQQLETWNGEKHIIATSIKGGSFKQREQLGLHHLAWMDSRRLFFAGPMLDSIVSLIPVTLRRKWKWIVKSEPELILDASGFAHSDQFGPSYPELLLNYYKLAKQRGGKIILLPQAFGPFKNNRLASAIKEIIYLSDLVYARDSISYKHLTDITGDLTHLKIAPDFTNLVEGVKLKNNIIGKNQPCIIPNSKMIEKTEREIRENYISFLATIIRHLQEKKLSPFILIHETRSDYKLAASIQKLLQKQIPIVQESDPLKIKGIIGASLLTVSSRYHGLINGLTQGVPSLATSWSHKYETLLEEYDCSQYLVSPLTQEQDYISLLDSMINENSREQLITKLASTNLQLKSATKAMWAEVKAVSFSKL